MSMTIFQESENNTFSLKEGSHKYSNSANSFKIGLVEFLVLKRKKKAINKPDFYLIAKSKPKDIYISSLFPVENEENSFIIDFRNIYYKIIFTDSCVNLKEIKRKRKS